MKKQNELTISPLTEDQLKKLIYMGPKTTYNYTSTATPGAHFRSLRSIKNEKEIYVGRHESILYAKMDISDYHVEDTSRYGPSLYFSWQQIDWIEELDWEIKKKIDCLPLVKIENPPPIPF